MGAHLPSRHLRTQVSSPHWETRPRTMSTSGLVSVLFWLEVGQPPPPPLFSTALVSRAQSFPHPKGFLPSTDSVWSVLAHLSTMLLLASICWARTLPGLWTGMLVPGPRGF